MGRSSIVGPVRSRARNIVEIILFPHVPSLAARAHECMELFDGLSLSLSFPLSLPPTQPSLFLSLSLSSSLLDGTPRLRGKSDIFRHGIWRSNDARAKLSTSIRLFVPKRPSATPEPRRSTGRNWKVSFCSPVCSPLQSSYNLPTYQPTYLPTNLPNHPPSYLATHLRQRCNVRARLFRFISFSRSQILQHEDIGEKYVFGALRRLARTRGRERH